MAYGDLPNKLEAAAKALLDANPPVGGLTGFTGQSGDDQVRPALTCRAERGEEAPQGSGNFIMELSLQVQSQADDTALDVHRGFFAWVVDLFMDSTAAATLSGLVADFYVLAIFNPRYAEEVQDRAYTSELSLTAYCCASDL